MAQPQELEVDEVEAILGIIVEKINIDLAGCCRGMLARRISSRIAQLSVTAAAYVSRCREDADECRALVDAIAINVSSFFRDPIVFETIARDVLPEIIGRDGKSDVRVWSAGCAAGEEAFSIAILLDRALAKCPRPIAPIVFATDIDRGALAEARKLRYQSESLREAKRGIVEDYFVAHPDGYEPRPALVSMTHFSIDDLLSDHDAAPRESVFGSFDLVLCRNVLIYFTPEARDRVCRRLYGSMAEGGYLVLGDSEKMSVAADMKLLYVDRKNGIYRK